MNAVKFIKEEICKNYEIGVSRLVFVGDALIEKLKTKAELRALVRSNSAWLKLAARDQSKRSTGTLVTILPIKKRSYKIYTEATWLTTPKEKRAKNYKIKPNHSSQSAYKMLKIRKLRTHLKDSRSLLQGFTYRKLRNLVKARAIDNLTKLTEYISNGNKTKT